MAELWYDPEADRALTALEQDPTRKDIVASVNDVLDRLGRDPGAPDLRRHGFTGPDGARLWVVAAGGRAEAWVVVWQDVPERPERTVLVVFIGPDPL